MEIRHLRLVNAVFEEGSLTNAAQKLHLSQSALSHQLRDLEEELKVSVFNRVNKNLVLTQAGQVILKSSQKILDELTQTERKINNMVEGETGTIRLSTECYTSYHWLPPIIKEFKKQYPNVEVEVRGGSEAEIVHNLLNGYLDIALVHEENNDANIKFVRFMDDELVTIFSPDHPFSKKDVILPRDLKGETLITHSKDFEASILNQKIYKRYNIVPANTIYVQLTGAALEMVKANLGITVMPRWIAGGDLEKKGLRGLPLTRNGLIRKWIIATLKDPLAPSYINHFIKLLLSNAREVVKS